MRLVIQRNDTRRAEDDWNSFSFERKYTNFFFCFTKTTLTYKKVKIKEKKVGFFELK